MNPPTDAPVASPAADSTNLDSLLAIPKPEAPNPAPESSKPDETPPPSDAEKATKQASLASMSFADQLTEMVHGKLPAKETKPAPAPEKKPDEAKTDAAATKQAAKDEDLTKASPKALRERLSASETAQKELRAELEKLKTAPKDDPEKAALLKELASVKETRSKLEAELATADFQRSTEFKEKFHTPLEREYKRIFESMKEFSVNDENSATGKRPGTAEDFVRIMQLPLQQAADLAAEMFGPGGAAAVLGYRDRITGMAQAARDAIENHSKLATEREQKRIAEQASIKAETEKALLEARRNLEEAVPDLFAPAKEDKEHNDLLDKGHKLVDLVFFGGGNLTKEQQISAITQVRARAAAFGPIVRRLNLLTAERDALKQKLTRYESSENPNPKPEGEEIPIKNAGEKSFEEELRETIARVR